MGEKLEAAGNWKLTVKRRLKLEDSHLLLEYCYNAKGILARGTDRVAGEQSSEVDELERVARVPSISAPETAPRDFPRVVDDRPPPKDFA